MTNQLGFLSELEEIIRERLDSQSDESYTATLVASGGTRAAQKVGEEAVELALAAATGSPDEQLEEAADLMFHILVLLCSKGLSLADVVEKLQQRHDAANGSRPPG